MTTETAYHLPCHMLAKFSIASYNIIPPPPDLDYYKYIEMVLIALTNCNKVR